MRAVCVVAMAALAIPAVAGAQAGAAGKWVGETQGRGGPQKVMLELKVDGKKLMGTFQQGEQPAADISEGMVMDAATVMFKRSIQGRDGNAFTIEYTGKINGNEMTLTPMFAGGGPGGGGGGGRGGRGPMPITLKRM